MISIPGFLKLRRRLRQLLRNRGQNPEDVEDLIQDAFLRLEMYYRGGGEVREPEAFLVRTALRLSSNARRTLRRRTRVEEQVAALPQINIQLGPEEQVAVEETLSAIHRSLSAVSESTRNVFLLHRLDGYTYTQIAKLCGMSNKAVERRIARAMLAVYRANSNVSPPEGNAR